MSDSRLTLVFGTAFAVPADDALIGAPDVRSYVVPGDRVAWIGEDSYATEHVCSDACALAYAAGSAGFRACASRTSWVGESWTRDGGLRHVDTMDAVPFAPSPDSERGDIRCAECGVLVQSGRIDLNSVAEVVRAAGFACTVEQTGGGVATVYAGQGDDGVPMVMVGPGHFYSEGGPSADVDECYVGLNSDVFGDGVDADEVGTTDAPAIGDMVVTLLRGLDEDARVKGADAGRAAGSWLVDGNTSAEAAAALLASFADCDHDFPSPLSGEWAGESVPELFGFSPVPAWLCDTYEAAFSEAYEAEVVRAASVIA